MSSLPNFFAEPYPGELWYSVVARNFYYSGYIFPKTYLLDCYGIQKRNFGLVIPSSLDSYIERNPWVSKEEIIRNHSAFPFFSPFLMESNHKALMEKKNCSLKKVLPNNLIRLQQTLRYCPVCSANDIEKHGEPYLHVCHHLPGIDFCPKDGHRLKETILPDDVDPMSQLLLIRESNLDLTETERLERSAELRVLSLALETLNGKYHCCNMSDVTPRLRSLFKTNGLGNIRWGKVYDLLEEKFQNSFLESVGIESVTSLREIRLNDSAQQPALCLTLISLFFENLDDFFEYDPDSAASVSLFHPKPDYRSGKKAPHLTKEKFSCPNPFCENHGKDNLEIYSYNEGSKKYIVRCEKCSMVMSVGENELIHIVQYGNLWHDNILRTYKCGYSYSETAKLCNVNESIARHQIRGESGNNPTPIDDIVRKLRKKLESLKESGLTLSQMKKITGEGCFNSLKAYDREWFEAFASGLEDRQIPFASKQEGRKISAMSDDVDSEDDAKALEELKKYFERAVRQYPPIRITATLMTRKSSFLHGAFNKRKYPESLSFIEAHSESVEDFRKRRAQMVVDHLIDSGMAVSRLNVIRETNTGFVKPGHGREEVDEYLKQLGMDPL